tara:strand:- start:31 stop:501 length:471 start_codon:yes stop_codon:yes gene_type:complete
VETLFKETIIPEETIKDILSLLNKYNFKDISNESCTENGYQTSNIVGIFNKSILKKILPFDNFYKKIFWIHYIKYHKDGYQVEHDHKKTEKYSFILYLNNSDGDTVFKEPVNKKITPKLGKLIFFDSDISHRAEISNEGKQVLVGAIDEKTQISKK